MGQEYAKLSSTEIQGKYVESSRTIGYSHKVYFIRASSVGDPFQDPHRYQNPWGGGWQEKLSVRETSPFIKRGGMGVVLTATSEFRQQIQI